MNRYMEILLRVPLFKGVAVNQLEELLVCLEATAHLYHKNETIFFPGDPVRSIGIVCTGAVQVAREDFTGNRTILALLGAGELFGEAFVCSGADTYPVIVTAVELSEVIMIDYRKIITTCPTVCSHHALMIENMMWVLAQKNILLNRKIEVLSARGTRKKLITYLAGQAQMAGSKQFTLEFDRQQMADYLCVDRSAMSAELSKMQKEGLIAFHKNRFEILRIPEESGE